MTVIMERPRFDAVWAQIENERLRKQVEQENEAAKEFDTHFPAEERIAVYGKTWGGEE